MAVRRSLSHLPGFVLAGAGIFLLSIVFWGWLSNSLAWLEYSLEHSQPNLFILVLLLGAGFGLLSWLGYELGSRLRGERSSRSPGPHGGYARDYSFGILVFLVLGTGFGLLSTSPSAMGLPVSGSGGGVALLNVLAYVILFAPLVLVPLGNGLLIGAYALRTFGAFLSGVAVTIGGCLAFVVSESIASLLVLPACERTVPQSCCMMDCRGVMGPWILVYGAAVAVVLPSSIAASLGVLVARITDARAAPASS
jgi:hypothetical protein